MSPCCFRARWRHSPWRSARFRPGPKWGSLLWNVRFRLSQKPWNPSRGARFRLNPRRESRFRLHPLHRPRLQVNPFLPFLPFLPFRRSRLCRRFLPYSLCRRFRLCHARATATGSGG